MTSPLVSVEEVTKVFSVAGRHRVQALDGVSLTIEPGECHAVVGESGSGKSTLGNLILGLYAPTQGTIRFKDDPLPARRPRSAKRAIQLVQQNPLSALNPRRTVGRTIRLGLDVHGRGERKARGARVAQLLEEVGLTPAYARRHPRGLSGGERQRIAIARALACEPELIILDEPTSSLDVLVQARILHLLARLRRQHGLTYLFITHDLAVVRVVADRVSVLERGRLVEGGSVEQIFSAPRSAYARRLLAAVPVVTDAEAKLRERFRGQAPADLMAAPSADGLIPPKDLQI
jgi:peptide/nickel transport system ATP-binding protein